MPKKPKSQGKQDRKQRLVRSAIECFVEKGVAHTTLREIAKNARIDQPLLHYYFKSLDDLYLEVIHVVLEDLKAASVRAAEATPDPELTLRRYITGTFEWARENPGLFSIWMYFYYLSCFHPTFTKLNREIRLAGRNRIALMIHQGIEKGRFHAPAGTTVQEIAHDIQGLMTGNCIMAASEGGDWKHSTRITVECCLSWLAKRTVSSS